MNNGHYLIIILSCLLLAFLLWQEAPRKNKARLVLRIVASVVAVVCFACLVLPVTINKKIVFTGKSLVLLTEGFNSDSVKEILNQSADVTVYSTEENSFSSREFQAKYLPGINMLPALAQQSALHVFGSGLTETDLNLLRDVPVVFHPSKNANGIVSAGWKKIIKQGDKLSVQGRVNNTTSSPLKVILTGFNTTLDSLLISSKNTIDLELTTVPKLLGRAVYSLIILSGKDTIENNPVPFEVVPSARLNVILLSSSPDFENKFLKNWLTKSGYTITTRTTITKGKYTTEFANTSKVNIARITSSLLDKCDVLIADAAELSSISKQELYAIQNLVEQKGMGLIVKADNLVNATAFYSGHFPLLHSAITDKNSLHLNLLDAGVKNLSLNVEQPLIIKTTAGTKPLISDERAQTFVSSILQGNGKIILSTLSNTYSWLLAGDTDSYYSFWSALLKSAAKQTPVNETWNVKPAIPRINEPAYLYMESGKANIPQGQVGDEAVYMEQDANMPGKWHGTYWPKHTGWQPAITTEGNTFWWYAYGKEDWKNVAAFEKINATKYYEQLHQVNLKNQQATGKRLEVEFPKIYFFLGFLMAAGFLWAEKKYYS